MSKKYAADTNETSSPTVRVFEELMERIKIAVDPDNLTMRVPEAVVYTQITREQLAQLRFTGKGPKFLKPSPRVVLYRKKDLDDWLKNSVHTSTAEVAA